MREDNTFKPISDIEDEGTMRESLLDFYTSSGKKQSVKTYVWF